MAQMPRHRFHGCCSFFRLGFDLGFDLGILFCRRLVCCEQQQQQTMQMLRLGPERLCCLVALW
jgi:hypothetical protein